MKAIYTHDCDSCELIGNVLWNEAKSDLYACFSEAGVCITVRYGNGGPDYISITFSLDAAKMVDELISLSTYRGEWTRLLGIVMDAYAWRSDRTCLGSGWNTAKFIEFAERKVTA